jgi:hypothetical protein
VPFVMGVRTPFESIEATEVLLTLQIMSLISALDGKQVAAYVLFVYFRLLNFRRYAD